MLYKFDCFLGEYTPKNSLFEMSGYIFIDTNYMLYKIIENLIKCTPKIEKFYIERCVVDNFIAKKIDDYVNEVAVRIVDE